MFHCQSWSLGFIVERVNGQRGNGPKSSERFSEILRGFQSFLTRILIRNDQESPEKC